MRRGTVKFQLARSHRAVRYGRSMSCLGQPGGPIDGMQLFRLDPQYLACLVDGNWKLTNHAGNFSG